MYTSEGEGAHLLPTAWHTLYFIGVRAACMQQNPDSAAFDLSSAFFILLV
jgi:hypothetical protein